METETERKINNNRNSNEKMKQTLEVDEGKKIKNKGYEQNLVDTKTWKNRFSRKSKQRRCLMHILRILPFEVFIFIFGYVFHRVWSWGLVNVFGTDAPVHSARNDAQRGRFPSAHRYTITPIHRMPYI